MEEGVKSCMLLCSLCVCVDAATHDIACMGDWYGVVARMLLREEVTRDAAPSACFLCVASYADKHMAMRFDPLQGSMLEKHKIQLQLSKRKAGPNSSSSKKSAEQPPDTAGTKVVVRNVAFEATRNDIVNLFGPFGHIKSCRYEVASSASVSSGAS